MSDEQATPDVAAGFVGNDDVHVHMYSLPELAAAEPEHEAIALLDFAERRALERMRSERRRLEFIRGRTALKRLLAQHAAIEPASVRIVARNGRKPYAEAPTGLLPAFNLSHCEGVLAIALSSQGAVGVDVEAVNVRLESDFECIARNHFTAAEQAAILDRPAGDRLNAFLRMWTLKEAVLKATGIGLFRPLETIEVAVPRERHRILQVGLGDSEVLFAEHRWLERFGVHMAVARVGCLGVVVSTVG